MDVRGVAPGTGRTRTDREHTMSDTSEHTGADGIPENTSTPRADEVRDEVRLDLDEGSLDTWDEVRGDYALDPESEVARPALTES